VVRRPGNDYSTHAIATMMDRLRAEPGAFGSCTRSGGILTKHALGIYSSEPPPRGWRRPGPRAAAWVDALPHPEIVAEPAGRGTIETYTIVHGRDGARQRGRGHRTRPTSGGSSPGCRTTPASSRPMEREEQVGRAGTVSPGPRERRCPG
jgi:acetyl-CoA C-acetyltransferase